MQDVGSGSDGVGAEVKAETCLLSRCNKTVCGGLVAGDIHITSLNLVFGFDAIYVGGTAVRIVSVVVTCLNHLYISLCDARFLGKLVFEEVERDFEVAVEEPTYQTEGEHIAAFEDALVVHTRIGEAVLHHRCEGAEDNAVGVDAHFAEVVFGCKLRLLQVGRLETIGIDDNSCIRLCIFILSFEGCGVHSHKHVAFVARSVNFFRSDMHLKTRNACQRTLRSANVCGIVGEGADAVTNSGRDSREDVAGELHTVARISRKPDNHTVQIFYFQIF